MTDTAGYRDLTFVLFGLLGYQFTPRLADIGDTRFQRLEACGRRLWRAQSHGAAADSREPDHPPWGRHAPRRWLVEVGPVNTTVLLVSYGGRPTLLRRAIGELGRIAKTQYLLADLDDESYRRRILTELNRGQARHSLE